MSKLNESELIKYLNNENFHINEHKILFNLFNEQLNKQASQLGYRTIINAANAALYLQIDFSNNFFEFTDDLELHIQLFVKEDISKYDLQEIKKTLIKKVLNYLKNNNINYSSMYRFEKINNQQAIDRYEIILPLYTVNNKNYLQDRNIIIIKGDVTNSIIGNNNTIQINIESIKSDILQKGGEDKEELLSLLDKITTSKTYKSSCFAQFSELINKHSWISASFATLILQKLLGG